MNPCPSLDLLNELLAERLTEDQRDALYEHLERCPSCHQRLEQLTSAAGGPRGLSMQLGAPPLLRAGSDALLERLAATNFARSETTADFAAGTTSAVVNEARALSAEIIPEAARFPQPPGYEVLGEIGRGGMGVVYKARQRSLNRLVALKMILAGFGADGRRRALFRAEADAIASLAHPNIVQIYEIGEHGDAPFLCLEYVDGGSLDKLLAGKPQPALRTAEFVATLARAIHFAHERGIVHRDLKPANILLASG